MASRQAGYREQRFFSRVRLATRLKPTHPGANRGTALEQAAACCRGMTALLPQN